MSSIPPSTPVDAQTHDDVEPEVGAHASPPEVDLGRRAWRDLFDAVRQCQGHSELRTLLRRARLLERTWGPARDLLPTRVALVSGGTPDLLLEPLELALRAFGLEPHLRAASFGAFPMALLDEAHELARFAPQLTIVIPTLHDLSHWPGPDSSREDVLALVERTCDQLLGPCRKFHERTGSQILLATLPPPATRPFSNLGAHVPGDPVSFVRRLDLALGDRAPAYVRLIDVVQLVERRGLERWFDARLWFQSRQAIAPECIHDFVLSCAAVAAAQFGRTRKCLVVDLDDTLWGGVVGDVGLEGLQLGQGSGVGEAHLAFQRYLADLGQRGVLLAVCSKNDAALAREAVARHPEMLLRLEHFAAFEASWSAKSDGLRAIAAELDLGLDALVFFDDNPAEREQVRQALPDVAVPEPGGDPSAFVAVLERCRYFEPASLTPEDRQRASSYRVRAAARELESSGEDVATFLASLQMRAKIEPFHELSVERIAQLCNKTNQFNLTTQRVTQAEVRALVADPSRIALTARLCDRFGDHGLVSVFWGRVDGVRLFVEQWLMSCRVFKRGLEHVLFAQVLRRARERGLEELVGCYVPTSRNGLVRELYAELGFRPYEDHADRCLWVCRIDAARSPAAFIELETGA